jgi:hypothetical protein
VVVSGKKPSAKQSIHAFVQRVREIGHSDSQRYGVNCKQCPAALHRTNFLCGYNTFVAFNGNIVKATLDSFTGQWRRARRCGRITFVEILVVIAVIGLIVVFFAARKPSAGAMPGW